MGFQSIQKGALPSAQDVQQIVNVFTGQADAGAMSLMGPVAAPTAAPSVTLSAGSLTGSYQWGTYWITGIPNGAGSYNATGRTTPSPYSTAQTLSSQEGTVSIAGQTIPRGVVGWGVVRNLAGGTTWYEVPGSEQFANSAGSLATVYVDNTADANLVTPAPATNTTGTKLSGAFSGAFSGTSAASFPQGLSTEYTALSGLPGATTASRYVGAVAGAAPTTGTFDVGDWVVDTTTLTHWICTAAGTPGTWENPNYLRTDANAPNPQTVANPVDFNNTVNVNGIFQEYYNLNAVNPTPGSTYAGTLLGWNFTAGEGETDLINYRGVGNPGGFRFYGVTNTSYPGLNFLAGVDGSGNASFAGSLTVSGSILNQHVEVPSLDGTQLLGSQSTLDINQSSYTLLATYTFTAPSATQFVRINWTLVSNSTSSSDEVWAYMVLNGVQGTIHTATYNNSVNITDVIDVGLATSFTLQVYGYTNDTTGDVGTATIYSVKTAARAAIVAGSY